jgi:hypothetical protein
VDSCELDGMIAHLDRVCWYSHAHVHSPHTGGDILLLFFGFLVIGVDVPHALIFINPCIYFILSHIDVYLPYIHTNTHPCYPPPFPQTHARILLQPHPHQATQTIANLRSIESVDGTTFHIEQMLTEMGLSPTDSHTKEAILVEAQASLDEAIREANIIVYTEASGSLSSSTTSSIPQHRGLLHRRSSVASSASDRSASEGGGGGLQGVYDRRERLVSGLVYLCVRYGESEVRFGNR